MMMIAAAGVVAAGPLYTHAGDATPGQTKGQGLDPFGAEWQVLSPAGKKIDEDDD